jgi:hypothetical protein
MRAQLQQIWNTVRRSLVAVSAVGILALSPVAVHADNYGSGNYNGDVYGSSSTGGGSSSGGSSGGSSGSSGSSSSSGSNTPASSSPTNESTVVQTPSGLQVAINLSDGQAIPSTGYYITITPLNGEGKSFDKAEIYLDGKLVYTGAPDSTGTLKWLWDTAKDPATKVKIIVYGPGDGVTTHEFTVTVSPVHSSSDNQTPTNSNPETAPATSGWPQWATWLIIALVIVILALLIWVIVRRRRNNQQTPPPTFTPMQ